MSDVTDTDLQNEALRRVIGMASIYLSSCPDRYGRAAAAINTVMDLLERRRAGSAPTPQMEICPNCQGTGTAGHPDSGNYCDCDGGVVPAAPATPAPDMREVERLADCLTAIGIPREQQRHAAAAKLRALSAENLALREKLEAAEAEKDSAIKWRDHYRTSWLDSRDRLTPPADLSAALQRVRDEAWNEAIEEASVIAETTPDDLVGTMELTPSQYAVAARIRALRRAPTEGEG